MGCRNRYTNEQRTFQLRGQERHYFEIHHIIPFSKGKEHDQIDNLAKLCPTCHRILTKNRAEEALQKETIYQILSNSPNAQRYVGILADSSDLLTLTEFVYSKLA
jgi:5-methylcytosine-specific restriction protein A